MHRSLLAPLLCVLLLVTAGCGDLSGGKPKQDISATPMDVPEDDSGLNESELPPGLSSSGVENPSALLAAHEAVLASQSVQVRFSGSRKRVSALLSSNRTRYRITQHHSESLREVASNGSVTYELNGSDGYRIQQVDGTNHSISSVTQSAFVARVLRTASTMSLDHFDKTEFSANGEAFYHLSGYADGTHSVLSREVNGTVSDVHYRAVITEEGLIRTAELYYDVTKNGDTSPVIEQIIFEQVGTTTVSEPPWWGLDRWVFDQQWTAQETLAEGNAAGIDNRSLTVYEEIRTEERNANGRYELRSLVERTGWIGANRSRYLTTHKENYLSANGTDRVRMTAWANGTARFERHKRGLNEYEYKVVRDAGGHLVNPTAGLQIKPLTETDVRTLLSAVSVDSISASNDHYTIHGRNVSDRVSFETWTGHEDVSNVSLRLAVREGGIVDRVHLDYDTVENGTVYRVHRELKLADIGRTDIPKPDWVEKAIKATSDSTNQSTLS